MRDDGITTEQAQMGAAVFSEQCGELFHKRRGPSHSHQGERRPLHHAMDAEFAVEVPAEANPLTEGILFHVLRSASSADPTQIQTGTKQLHEWERARGYYPLLQVRPKISAPTPVPHLAPS